MKRIYLGLFLISLASLALEISYLRLFSVSLWYHFAFMMVSIALFGLAASGTFLSIKALKNPLFFSCLLFSFSSLLGFYTVNTFSFDLIKASLDLIELAKLSLYYIFLGLPFFFSGLIVAFCLKEFQEKAGTIYFVNLSGAALGSLAAIPLLQYSGARIVTVIAVISALASLFYLKRKKQILPLLILVVLILFVPINLKISPYKELNQALNYPRSEIEDTLWSAEAKVDVVKSSFIRYAPGLSLAYQKPLPEQLGLMVDGSSVNAITKASDNLEFLDYLPQALAFKLLDKPKTLVINSGGGQDILLSLEKESSVTTTESNPIILDLLEEKYKEFSGEIYQKSKVVNEQGRSFIKKGEKFDLIILSQAGSVLGGSTGLYNFTENYLLTKEALEDYYNSLTDQGFFIVNRWLSYPPRESLKLLALTQEIENYQNKMVLFRSNQTVTLLLAKKDLDEEQIKIIKEFTKSRKYDLIFLANQEITPNQFNKFEEPYYYQAANNFLKNPRKFSKDYIFNLEIPTDNKPFYFNFFKWSKIKELYQAQGERWQPFLDQGFILWFLFFQAMILGFVFIILPISVLKKIAAPKLPLFYFFFIGLGYLFIQVVLIQKMILFLGQPLYATASVIASMLFFASLGSLISQKLNFQNNFDVGLRIRPTLAKIIFLLGILIIIYFLSLSLIIEYLMTLSLNYKLILSIILIAPLSFVMGFPFPVALRKIKKDLVPYAWSLNGVASVLSPVLATILALSIGFNGVLLGATTCYLLALGLFIRSG